MGITHSEETHVTAAHHETVSDVLTQLSQLIAKADVDSGEAAEGVTCRELAKTMGLSRGRVGEKLRDLIDDGLIKVEKGWQVSPITGFSNRTYFYSPSKTE